MLGKPCTLQWPWHIVATEAWWIMASVDGTVGELDSGGFSPNVLQAALHFVRCSSSFEDALVPSFRFNRRRIVLRRCHPVGYAAASEPANTSRTAASSSSVTMGQWKVSRGGV